MEMAVYKKIRGEYVKTKPEKVEISKELDDVEKLIREKFPNIQNMIIVLELNDKVIEFKKNYKEVL